MPPASKKHKRYCETNNVNQVCVNVSDAKPQKCSDTTMDNAQTETCGDSQCTSLPEINTDLLNSFLESKTICELSIPAQIHKIVIKRNAPQLIKDIFNSEHNRKVIEDFLNYIKKYNTKDLVISPKYVMNCQTQYYDSIVKSWLKLLMLHHLKYHVFTRLASIDYPSNGNDVIVRGVAIQAIRKIPKGTRVFENMRGNCSLYYPIDISEGNADTFENVTKENPIKALLNDFFLQLNSDNVIYPVMALGPNAIDMSFFLNHSFDTENIKDDDNESKCDMSSYITTRDIEKGEYLNINYIRFTLDSNGKVSKTKLDNLLNRMPFLKTLKPFDNYVNGSLKTTDIKYWLHPQSTI